MTEIIPKENFKVTSIENGYSIETNNTISIEKYGSMPLIMGFVILEHERTRFICCRNWPIETLVYIEN